MWHGQGYAKLVCWSFKILKMLHNLTICHIRIPIPHNYFTYLSALVNLLSQLPHLNGLQKSERLFY